MRVKRFADSDDFLERRKNDVVSLTMLNKSGEVAGVDEKRVSREFTDPLGLTFDAHRDGQAEQGPGLAQQRRRRSPVV